MIIPGAASLSSLTLDIAGLQSYAQAVVTRGGRVGQVNFGETDENPSRGGALLTRGDR